MDLTYLFDCIVVCLLVCDEICIRLFAWKKWIRVAYLNKATLCWGQLMSEYKKWSCKLVHHMFCYFLDYSFNDKATKNRQFHCVCKPMKSAIWKVLFQFTYTAFSNFQWQIINWFYAPLEKYPLNVKSSFRLYLIIWQNLNCY